MKLIVGLGNPGEEYTHTRHNVGFMFLDYLLAKTHSAHFDHNKKCESDLVEISINEIRFLLQKPHTFMNESGRAVRKCMDFYKIPLEDVIIVHDDLDIKLGHHKIQKGKGPKMHNGVNSVENVLGSSDFIRVRIGVENRLQPIVGSEYVLNNFTKDEESVLTDVFAHIDESLSTKTL